MDFCRRAQNALERDDPARGLMILVRGLRGEPEHEDGLDLLLFIYTRHIGQPGLEAELLRALEFHPQQGVMLRLVIDELRQLDKPQMAEAVETAAGERGVEIASAAAPELEDDSEGQDSAEGLTVEGATPPNIESGGPGGGEEPEQRRGAGSSPESEQPVSVQQHQRTESDSGPRSSNKRESGQKGDRRRRLLVLGLGALAVVVGASVALVIWQHAREAQQLIAVDEALVQLDPLDTAPVDRRLQEAERPLGVDARLLERRWFTDALVGLDSGESPQRPEGLDELQTSWGLGAAALEEARDENWEEAMRYIHQLEREYADTLAGFVVKPRVCEVRRQWECAAQGYQRVQNQFEKFIPAHQGAMRVEAARFDADRWTRHKNRLAELAPDHLYADLEWFDPFETTRQEGEIRGEDRFLRQWATGAGVVDALAAQDWSRQWEQCKDPDEGSGLPALSVGCAKMAAGRAEVQIVAEWFEQAAEDPEISPELVRQLQQAAPRLLADLGRADLGLKFVIHDDVSEGEFEEVSPTHFAKPQQRSESSDEALLVRGRTLVDAGELEAGVATLERLTGRADVADRAKFELVRATLMKGDRDEARRTIGGIEDERLGAGAEAYLAYLEGRHGEARQVGWERGDDPRVLRVMALGYLSEGRGRDAMVVLDAAGDGLDTLVLRPVKFRVYARAGESAALDSVKERLPQLADATTVEVLIDAAAAAFWQRELRQAQEGLGRVLDVAPNHPEAHWKMGLLKRAKGQQAGAQNHFRNAWRGDEDSTRLLIESGRVQLDAGRYEQAREVFLTAALRERDNAEAVEGLGEAYHRGSRERGRRDLVGLLENYGDGAGEQPARAEMYRWLAILHDSRDGDEEGLNYLQRARKIGGDRPTLLVELGRYYEAREKFDKAREQFGAALRVDPTVPEVHLGLARAAAETGDEETAREHLRRLQRLVPVGEVHDDAEAYLKTLQESGR